LHYDVASAIARHEALVASGAPMPSWAGAGTAAKAGLTAIVWPLAGALILAGAMGVRWSVASVASVASAPAAQAQLANVVGGQVPAVPAPVAEPGGRSAAPSPEPITVSFSDLPAAPAPQGSPAPVRGLRRTLPTARPLAASADSRADVAPIDPTHAGTATPVTNAEIARPATAPEVPARRDDAPDGSAEDLRELQEIATAERLLPTDPARALTIVREAAARYPTGYLREEGRYIEVGALFALGSADAEPAARAFLHAYPTGPFGRQVKAALAVDAGSSGRARTPASSAR
jgi:hypothetical protein